MPNSVITSLVLGFLWIFLPAAALCSQPEFTIFKLGSAPDKVLIVGGIQGDEPGGFSAANLLATRYEIKKGSVIVIPNLNFASIIKRSRGLYGDMNRKFALLDASDPEYDTVRKIQSLISDPDVKLVLNLHDGSGYYRPRYEDKLRNQNRWGQSIIIDQSDLLPDTFMGDLENQASDVATEVNSMLIEPTHTLHVHNTNTAAGDREMEKSLSYYAARQNKAAFGLEASKELSVAGRTYYHLKMIEAFLKRAGVEFSRDFELTPKSIERALTEHLGVSFAGNRIFLPLENARQSINRLPLPKNPPIITSKPIMAVIPCEHQAERLCIHYGNRMVAFIRPDWRVMNEELDGVIIIADGVEKLAAFGQTIDIEKDFSVKPISGFRVNAIGYDTGLKDEAGKKLSRHNFEANYSLDKNGDIYRVEVYKDQSFAGMFLVRFRSGKPVLSKNQLPGRKGKESDLGR